MKVRKTIVAALLALGVIAGLAGPAGASRADGVCGGAPEVSGRALFATGTCG